MIASPPQVICMRPGALALPLSVLLVPMILLTGGTAAANTRHEGLAYAKGTQRLLYREEHWLASGAAERLVLYRCPGGQPFARKWVRGAGSAPDFEFIDGRTGYAEGVRTTASGREVFTREASNAPEQRSPVLASDAQIIDAGFDSFVRQRWDTLAPPRQTRVNFLIPSRRETIALKLVPSAGAPGSRIFRLSLDAWYGRALPALAITYSARGDRLMRFEGISNIRDHAGGYQAVRIEFPADRRTASSAAAQGVAAAAPLVRDCGKS